MAYLNCAFHGALPRVAAAAVVEALRLKQTPHRIRDEHHFDFPDAYRRAVAALVGGGPEEVAVADSATHGIMLLVAGLDWKRGDEVVLPAGEFPANLFPWRSLETRGVVVREVEIGSGEEATERLVAALGPRARVLSLSWVSYTTGLRLDLAALGAACRERGVLFAVDGSQGVGGLPFDLAATPCDLLACAGYKWLLGPYGLGFARLTPALAERLTPRNINWFAIDGARDFARLSRCRLAFAPGARRFDINEPANFLNTAAGTAALEYLARVTPAAVERHVRTLLDHLLESLPAGFHPVSDLHPARRSNILCLAGENEEITDRARAELAARRVVVSRREGALRVSPHLYNTRADIDRLLEGLQAAASGP